VEIRLISDIRVPLGIEQLSMDTIYYSVIFPVDEFFISPPKGL
jgi:hypothetical protein